MLLSLINIKLKIFSKGGALLIFSKFFKFLKIILKVYRNGGRKITKFFKNLLKFFKIFVSEQTTHPDLCIKENTFSSRSVISVKSMENKS